MKPLEDYTFQLRDVPLLMISRGTPTAAAADRGTVLLLHGQGVHKEVNRPELTRFAEAGFLAIGVDVVAHGERRRPDYEQHFSDPQHKQQRFVELISEASRELSRVIGELKDAGLAYDGGVGVFGISMGGFIGYGAVPSGEVNALVAVIASPVWMLDVPENPARHVDRFFPAAVLSQVGGKDALIDAGAVKHFHERLASTYLSALERQQFVLYPESAHHMREQDWNEVVTRAVEWFGRFLKPAE